jgi:hypothetical protein
MSQRQVFLVTLALCFAFLAFSGLSNGQETSTRISGGMETNAVQALQVTKGPLSFESNKVYYVHPGALKGVTQLTLNGLQNTEIHFLAPLSGSRMMWTTYGNDVGILNVVDCDALKITGLTVENTYVFKPGNPILESSVAVNVSRSNVTFQHCTITGNGKSPFLVHSGSLVGLEDSTINAYYFEMQVGASTVLAKRCVFNQDHITPDSHSAIWTSSSMRNGETNVLYENTNVTLEDITFNMADGRSVVSGNGSYSTRSNVTLVRPIFQLIDTTFGIATWHGNYNSITVFFDGVPTTAMVDYISTPAQGIARFVNFYATPTTPGGAGAAAPIIVDGVSSVNVTP